MAIKRIFFAGFATIFLASGLTACSYNDNAASVQNKTMQTEDTTVIQQNKETEAFNRERKNNRSGGTNGSLSLRFHFSAA